MSRRPVPSPALSRRAVLRLGVVGVFSACGPDADDPGGDPLTNPTFALPRITDNDTFYVVQYDRVPEIDATAWRLGLDGLVVGPASLSLADLVAMGARDKEHTLQCIGAGPRNLAIGNAVWAGLPLSEVLAHANLTVDSAVRFLHLFCADGFVNQLERADLDDDRIWLVTHMNGVPLPPDHGFPARLLVRGRYGYKNAKWIERITFAADPITGTWQELGYPDDGANRPAAFVHFPLPQQPFERAPVDLVGAAFCGDIPITSVELSHDDGATWQPARMVLRDVPDVWTLWRLRYEPARSGEHVFLVRVRAADGRTSLAETPPDNAGWQGYGQISFLIR